MRRTWIVLSLLVACSAPAREAPSDAGGVGVKDAATSGVGGVGASAGAAGTAAGGGGAPSGGGPSIGGGGLPAGGVTSGGGASSTGGVTSGGGAPSGGASGITCPSSQHECNGVCVDNTPANGCAQGCGPCPVPQHGVASCVSGACSFSCPAMCSKVGSGCDCPKAQCCSDSECNPAPGSSYWCYYGKCLIGPAKCDEKLCWASCTSCKGKTGGKCTAISGGIYCTCDF